MASAVATPLPPTIPPTTAPIATTNLRVYNAIYSSVQVYECMVRGIAVMRRRMDSYVNATQILKVAGIDKGRRTKILEKEILPGRHEIVQGGYGKYQGTWIPLERGREVATQFGVLPLLAPLFDYVPVPNSVGNLAAGARHPPPHTLYSFHQHPGYPSPYAHLGPSFIPPGTAMTMLQQGRASGLFTPTQAAAFPPPPQQLKAGGQSTPLGLAYSLPGQQGHPLLAPIPQTLQPPAPLKASGSSGSLQNSTPSTTPQPSQSSVTTTQTNSQPKSKRPRAESSVGAPPPSQQTATAPSSQQSNNSRDGTAGNKPSEEVRQATPTIPPAPTDSGDNRAAKRPRLSPTLPQAPTEAAARTSTPQPPAVPTTTQTQTQTQPQPQTAQQPQPQPAPQPGPSSSQINASSNKPPTVSHVKQPSQTHGAVMPHLWPLPPSNHKVDPPNTRAKFSTKPPALRNSDADRQAPLKSTATRAILLAMFQDDDPASVIGLLGAASPPDGPPDMDMILDDQGHTPLHWAVSLARLPLAQLLVNSGADVDRGNFSGETPLMRAVLSTNNHEQQIFHETLTLLQGTLRTVDSSARSVMHHVAHVAGVRGRAASARYYMETILERLVRNKKDLGGFADLVDLQDVHGDTVLNISARVGNRALVRMLIDVGANRILANKLGLRPGDFGVEGENLKAPQAEDFLSILRKGPSPPVQKSQDVVADMTAMIQGLSTDFQAEIKVKQDALDVTQAHLRAATRELADQRRQTQQWQSTLAQLDQVQQRIRNVERVLKEEDNFDWTGRTESDGSPVQPGTLEGGVSKMFAYRGQGSSLSGVEMMNSTMPAPLEVDPPIPNSGTGGADAAPTWIRLKRMTAWHSRVEDLMTKRIEGSKGASAEKEFQCRKVVSLCTDVPIDKVDSMLEKLVIAMESDGQVVDLGRVAGFMQKVSEGASY